MAFFWAAAPTCPCRSARLSGGIHLLHRPGQYIGRDHSHGGGPGWGMQQQGTVLSAFFAGYILLQVVGGRLADRYGGKAVLGAGVVLWSLFTMLTPPAAALGFTLLILTRIGHGYGRGRYLSRHLQPVCTLDSADRAIPGDWLHQQRHSPGHHFCVTGDAHYRPGLELAVGFLLFRPGGNILVFLLAPNGDIKLPGSTPG